MIKLSLKRPVTVLVVFFAIAFSGFLFFKQLSLSLFPSFDYPELTIVTEYRGASPFEVEEYITKKLEQAVGGIDGVKRVHSISKENISVIRVVFNWGENIEYAYLSLREKLDAVRMRNDFPKDASRPVILKWNPAESPIMGIFVSADEPIEELTETLETGVKQRLEGIDGVAAVQFKGGKEKEVIVEFLKDSIELHRISIGEIESAISSFNIEQMGGVISKEGFRYSLRIASPVNSIEDLKKIPIKKAGYRTIYLKDIANIYYGSKRTTVETRMNGKQGVLMLVYKTPDSNTLKVVTKVKKALKGMNKDFPGLNFSVAFENSRFIKTAIDNVIQTIVLGGILAFLVILFFLGDFKAPFIISLSIPISILFTFTIMRFFKVNLNIMSLSGLALGVGMLVDNSIVVIESIFQEKEKNNNYAEYAGTKNVAIPVLASTLTTVSVFFPLLFVYGVAGRIFKDQSLTVTASLLASYLVSISLVPVIFRYFFKERKETSVSIKFPEKPKISINTKLDYVKAGFVFLLFVFKILLFIFEAVFYFSGRVLGYILKLFFVLLKPMLEAFNILYQRVFSLYHKMLEKSLDNLAVLFAVVGLLLFAGIFSGKFLKKEFFPKTKRDFLSFSVQLPENSSLKASTEFSKDFEEFLMKDRRVKKVLAIVGIDPSDLSSVYEASGENILNYRVVFKGDERKVRERILSYFKRKNEVNLNFKKESDEFSMVFKSGVVSIKFLSEKRTDAVNFAKKVKKMLEKDNNVISISDNFSSFQGKGIKLVFDRDSLVSYGISPVEIANFIASSINGKIVTSLKKVGRNYSIRVIMDKKDRGNLNSILNSTIFKNGTPYKLSMFLKKRIVNIPQKLERERQMPMATLTFNLKSGVNPNNFVNGVLKRLNSVSHRGVIVLPGGDIVEMNKSLKSLYFTLFISFLLVYLLLSAQFESFKIPFIIIFTFPMGLAGAFSLLFVFNQSLNVISAIGLIVLSGIVVNDAIVKVDWIHQKVNSGKDVLTAIFEASKEKFRPIWMTTITTVIGLMPVFIFKGAGSDLLKPLAIVLTGGMIVATSLTLFLIPALYLLFAKKNG